jgi:hypothetical protein
MKTIAYQFTLRSVLTFAAKCGCLLSLFLLSDERLAAVAALPVFAVWMPFELAISQAREPRIPMVVLGLFLLGRMAFVYATCLAALATLLILRSLGWTRPWSVGQSFVVAFGVTMLFGCAALLSLASCILAAVSWRWDRRARWLVYLNGGYLATTAAVLGVMSLL